MKISLCIPTNRGLNPKTLQCLLELVSCGKYEWHIIVAEEGYTIAENRNYCAVQALNNKSDYLFFIDDDMTFPADILDTLISNDKDICGTAYHPRCDMGQIIKYLDETHIVKLEETDDPKYKTTFECHATGTGICLIKCDVFKKIPRPWFMFEYYETGQCKLGEDWFFCEKAKKFGIKTFADPRPKVGHLGEVIL